MVQKIIRAGIEGQCAGILWALKGMEYLVSNIKKQLPKVKIFAYPIGHNEEIIGQMKDLGILLVKNIHEVPSGSIYLISAHGCSPKERNEAEKRGVVLADLTCPLVARNHKLIHHALEQQHTSVIIIGHKDHQEIRGYLGIAQDSRIYCVDSERSVNELFLHPGTQEVIIILQTTLSQRDIKPISQAIYRRFGQFKISDFQGRCYATINRQNALLKLIKNHNPDAIVVVGDIRRSSNTKRLFELSRQDGIRTIAVLNKSELNKNDFSHSEVIGVTAGASTIPLTVEAVVNQLEEWFKIKAQRDKALIENEAFPEQLYQKQFAHILEKFREGLLRDILSAKTWVRPL